MGFFDLFSANRTKEENQKLKSELKAASENIDTLQRELGKKDAELETLKSFVSPEQKETMDIELRLARLREEEKALLKRLSSLDSNVQSKQEELSTIEKEVVDLNEVRLLQDYGLYEARYDFATSDEYKDALAECREDQKAMIFGESAATCDTEWTVNQSLSEGRKMIKNNIKQILMTFNIECENVINKVKFNNVEKSKERIDKTFARLNKLNASHQIHISDMYLKLKHDELYLAYEYARKKQEEKERQREEREILRENERVQKELEAEKKRLEKEKTQYQKQLDDLKEKLNAEPNEEKRAALLVKIKSAESILDSVGSALNDVDYRRANQRAGYVYIISNIGSFGEGVYKIGMTRRLDPMDRVNELGDASVPFRFDVHAFIFSDDAPKLETSLHNAFADRRVNMVNNRKEFYRVPLEEIERVVKESHDKTVDFKRLCEAEQYRESVRIKAELESAHQR